MFKLLTITALMIVATGGLVACGGNDASNQAATTTETQSDTATPAPQHAAETPSADAQTASVTVEGTLGCGHCTHHIGESCSAAVQTADGKVYILQGMQAGSEPFDQRFSQKKIEVTGTVTETDGVQYLTVSSFQLL